MCDTYRPISLLQTYVKILDKISTNRLKTVILSLIKHYQTGFMPGKLTFLGVRRVYSNIHAQTFLKAFDSVECPYLWAMLEVFGFGPNFVK